MINCLLCRARCNSTLLCRACLTDLPATPSGLCRCALHPAAEQLCGQCLQTPPPFERVIAAYPYGYPLDQLLGRYKYQRQLAMEPALAALWLQHLPDTPVDALVPMPLHWRRQVWRGFNQAARLAVHLARARQLPLLHALRRCHASPPQQALDARRRRDNLSAVFAVQSDVSGLRLALVDDVVTTGASARAASACLLAGGAAQVEVWSLLRTF